MTAIGQFASIRMTGEAEKATALSMSLKRSSRTPTVHFYSAFEPFSCIARTGY
jgi:hypothetical protein